MKAIELCAGGGGASLGLELAGFEPVALVDNEPNACATLRHNRPYWNVLESDVREVDFSAWKGIDLLSGGLPCPPYSIAGVLQGAQDERDLFPTMLHIVSEVEPKSVLIENVKGLMNSKFASVRSGFDQAMDAMGYQTHWHKLNAAFFGVPQTRVRAFMVAIRRPYSQPFDWPTPSEEPTAYVGDAIADLVGGGGWSGATEWCQSVSRFLSPTLTGGSTKHGGPDLGPTRARTEWRAKGVYPLIITDKPPPPEGSERFCLTVRMLARLQGFPDSWDFCGSKTQQCRQIGNALPPPMMAAVAREVARCLRS